MKTTLTALLIWSLVGAQGVLLLISNRAHSQTGATAEWERTMAAAKKEGKLVAGIPASADLRKQLEAAFKAKFPGIEIELSPSRGPQNVRKIAEEYKAGIRNFDLSIGGTDTMLYGFVEPAIAEPFEPYMILPEVKDPKQWWGGHIWGDNQSGKRFIYSFEAFTSDNLWHNTELVKAEEIRSYDDLLHPKWKGKIAILDPRNPGAGHSTWTFLWMIKGEEFLKKLVQQDLLVSTNQRLLGEALAKGNISLTIGISYYTLEPFLKAGLPVKALPVPKEGTYTSNGSGTVTVVRPALIPIRPKYLSIGCSAKSRRLSVQRSARRRAGSTSTPRRSGPLASMPPRTRSASRAITSYTITWKTPSTSTAGQPWRLRAS